jgi:hypothetical protein
LPVLFGHTACEIIHDKCGEFKYLDQLKFVQTLHPVVNHLFEHGPCKGFEGIEVRNGNHLLVDILLVNLMQFMNNQLPLLISQIALVHFRIDQPVPQDNFFLGHLLIIGIEFKLGLLQRLKRNKLLINLTNFPIQYMLFTNHPQPIYFLHHRVDHLVVGVVVVDCLDVLGVENY